MKKDFNMNTDLVDRLVALERQRLRAERERLDSARSFLSSAGGFNNKNNNNSDNASTTTSSRTLIENQMHSNDLNHSASAVSCEDGKGEGSTSYYSMFTHTNATDNELDEGCTHTPVVPELKIDFNNKFTHNSSDVETTSVLSKQVKDLVNRQAISSAKENLKNPQELDSSREAKKTFQETIDDSNSEVELNKKNNVIMQTTKIVEDDMEQWVSDTFYSYFPSYNNEYQKRQNYLRERQQENQQNFIRHQQLTKPMRDHRKQANNLAAQNLNTTRSSSTDKTDLEILLVNNPNYVPPKYNNNNHNVRPATNRNRLLQDLKHTDLANIVSDNGIAERNRNNAESILAGKQNYQRELMMQIEEKRRSIERLRERERLQEETLTKRLEDQLKAIKLEEQLEKEKMRQDRILFDNAQSRLLREHLLAKLENDAKLLDNSQPHAVTNNERSKKVDKNRVYQYFSNSARREYREGQGVPATIELDVEIPERVPDVTDVRRNEQHGERECFHLSEHVCPQCNAPLRMYESSCLRCQRKLSIKTKVQRKAETQGNGKPNGNVSQPHDETQETQVQQDAKEAPIDTDAEDVIVEDVRAYSLVCTHCERLYAMCPSCLAQSDVCRACHRKRNVCLNCRRTLCSFCLEEIASGRDAEHRHINDVSRDDDAFEVLEVNYQTTGEEEDECTKNSMSSPEATKSPASASYGHNLAHNHVVHNKLSEDKPNNVHDQVPAVAEISRLVPAASDSDEIERIESLHRETERRMSRYMKNYGDLAQRQILRSKSESRGTQTTPQSAGRRDIVLQGENNLSMPLLREMPKMTRKSQPPAAVPLSYRSSHSNIDNLKRRWEVPAVQKFTITPKSPRVLTQIGAIRQQLQAASLFDDETDQAY